MPSRQISSFTLAPIDGVSNSLRSVSDALDDLSTCDLSNQGYVRSVLEDMSEDMQSAARWVNELKETLKNVC